MRTLASTALLLVLAACLVPETPATGPLPTTRPDGGGAQPDAGGPAGCTCYFENWSLFMDCGTRCLGDSKLNCSASAATVDPLGCAVAGTDAGQADDVGVAGDAGIGPGSICTPDASVCGCTIHPYDTEGFSLIIPCCTTVCFASQTNRAWSCSAGGQTELIGVPAVCRQ